MCISARHLSHLLLVSTVNFCCDDFILADALRRHPSYRFDMRSLNHLIPALFSKYQAALLTSAAALKCTLR